MCESVATVGMSLEELNAEVREFCQQRNWEQFHTPKELSIGLSTESNELLQLFRFKTESQQQELLEDSERREEIEEELADVLFFLLRFGDLYDVDLEDALTRKVEKNRERYPVKQYKGSNDRHDE